MRVLFVIPWDQESGGVTSVVGNLARYLQDRGHKCYFFNPAKSFLLKRKMTRWHFPGFELRLVLPNSANHPLLGSIAFPLLFFPLLCQLAYLILSNRIQVINIHYPINAFGYFGLWRWFLPVKVVTSIHGADLFPCGEARKRYPLMLRFLLYSSDVIVAPSRNFLKDILRIFPSLKDKSMCIYNSIDTDEFDSSSSVLSHKDHRKYLLSVAALNVKKGVDTLIYAFSILKDSDPSLKLVLVGNGPLRKQLEDLSKTLLIHDRIDFVGWRNHTEVINLLHNCEAFVLPSRSEPFGIAIIEALACQKPVISTTAGGIPEIIENGINGILVEPDNPTALANAISSVLKDTKLRRSLGQNGYITVLRRFQRENTGASYEETFSNLLKWMEVRPLHT